MQSFDMKKFILFIPVLLLLNCMAPPDQYLPEEVTRRHPGENDIVRLIDSRKGPQLIKTTNIEISLQEILDSGYSLLEQDERRTRTFDLMAHGRRIKADVILYQTGGESDAERQHRLVTPGRSFEEIPAEMKPIRQDDDYAEKAVFLVRN